MKIAVIGYGFVGKAMKKLFPDALVYDPFAKEISSDKKMINQCDVAFVCVPTPPATDGSCDTSIVEETVAWLKTPLIIIRSTVAPGTTERLIRQYRKRIVFQPEYIGETVAHPHTDESSRAFLVFGGSKADCGSAIEVYKTVYNASVRIYTMAPSEAEIVKYFVNTTIGTMVTLCNEFYDICQAFDVSYDTVREGYLADNRMSRYFTFVYPQERGFGGKCLPKDINAIVRASERAGYGPELIRAVLGSNDRIQGQTPSIPPIGSKTKKSKTPTLKTNGPRKETI